MNMKYLITESKLNSAMVKAFENLIDFDSLDFYHPTETNHDDYTIDFTENINARAYYRYDDEDEEVVFRYYTCDYFTAHALSKGVNCPTIELENYYSNYLTDIFGDLWKEPFKEWISDKTGLKIKSIGF